MIKRRTARLLRRLANQLDPQPTQVPRVIVTYNGQPVDKAVVSINSYIRRYNLRRMA